MYTRSNIYPEAPGRWITADGEYEFLKVGKSWSARRRDSGRIIGTGATLANVLVLASRYYVNPVVPVDRWQYATTGTAADGTPMVYGRGGWTRQP